jgi:hypothetical protein
LLVCLRNDPFAHVIVRDIIFPTEVVEEMPSPDAEFRFEGIGAIVKPSMNNLQTKVSDCENARGAEGGVGGVTSEFRELVSIPTAPFLSMSRVLVLSLAANCLAIARPTAPPPMIWLLSAQTCQPLVVDVQYE